MAELAPQRGKSGHIWGQVRLTETDSSLSVHELFIFKILLIAMDWNF